MKKTITTTIFLLTILWQVEKTGTLQAESKAFPTRAAARKKLKKILDRELNEGMFASREREDICDGELDDNICPDSANVWADGLTLTLEITEQEIRVRENPPKDIRWRKGRTETDHRTYHGYTLSLHKAFPHKETLWHVYRPDGAFVDTAMTLGGARAAVVKDLISKF